VTCDEPTARRLSALLDESFGADTAIAAFETNNGGTWIVEITFAAPPDEGAVRRQIEAGGADPAALRFSTIAERDWVKASLADFKPVRAGRFLVHGAHHRGQFAPNMIGIEIEAALAFGTGHHGTTRGCLLALDRWTKAARLTRRHRTALDVGTGTGVLAIAAARALHCKVFATDIDPLAVAVAKANARHNRTGPLVAIRNADGRRGIPWRGSFDLILANILLGPLTRMARPLAHRLAPGGSIVLSGLLPAQANAALAAYRVHGLAFERRLTLDNWVTLVMRRNSR
jgi:ribosomal protein L11 methyltransferase